MSNKSPFFGFEISPEASNKMQDLIKRCRAAADSRPFAMEIYQIVEELSDVGLHYFFIRPLKLAGIGGLKIKAVEMAMNMGKNAVLSVGKGILKAMSHPQLLVVIDLMENSLLNTEPNER